MKRRLIIFWKIVVPALSVLACAGAGWLWHRSFHVADYCYRLERQDSGCALRGFGSYRGAVVLASVIDPMPTAINTAYRIETYTMADADGRATGGPSILKPVPAFYAKALGFGISHGQLSLNLPLAWMLPTRTYHAIYIPYYFIMLLTAILPMRWGWKLRPSMKSREIIVGSPDAQAVLS